MKGFTLVVLLLAAVLVAGCPKAESVPAFSQTVSAQTAQPVEAICPDHVMCDASAITCMCDGTGKLLWQDLDHDRDGVVNQRTLYTYDDQGHVLYEDKDYGADGEIFMRCFYNPPCPPGMNCIPSCSTP